MAERPESNITFTVSSLTEILKDTVETVFSSITVEGEVSGLKQSAQGHFYFTLKDEKASISCILWRSKALFAERFSDGDQIVIHGSLSIYEARGQYNLVCDTIQSAGLGRILAELERRRRLYQDEGLFDESRKRPIPQRPSRIGVVTSPTGAAIKDILSVLGRRSGGIDILILPAVVQGPDAAAQIARRIAQANEFMVSDVLIVGRGGGSIEDLLPFSDDAVIRAVASSEIPVISAVGHEIDWALCDYAADLRAATPSAAAELVAASSIDQTERLAALTAQMKLSMRSRLRDARLLVTSFSLERVRRILDGRMTRLRMRSDELSSSLQRLMHEAMLKAGQHLAALKSDNIRLIQAKALQGALRKEKAIQTLTALSPLSILGRGYSIINDEKGNIIKSADSLADGMPFQAIFADGRMNAVSKGKANEGKQ